MRKTKFGKTVALLGALVILSAAGIAEANPAYHSSSSLNQEQTTRAQELITEHRTTVAPLEQQLNAKQAELNVQLYSAEPDKVKIEAISKDIGAIQGQIYTSAASLHAQLAKEGIPTNGRQGNQGVARGHGGGCGGGHGGGHW